MLLLGLTPFSFLAAMGILNYASKRPMTEPAPAPAPAPDTDTDTDTDTGIS